MMCSILFVMALWLVEDASECIEHLAVGKALNVSIKSVQIHKNGIVTARAVVAYEKSQAGIVMRTFCPDSLEVPSWGLPWSWDNQVQVATSDLPNKYLPDDPMIMNLQSVSYDLSVQSGRRLSGVIQLSHFFTDSFRQSVADTKTRPDFKIALTGRVHFRVKSESPYLRQIRRFRRLLVGKRQAQRQNDHVEWMIGQSSKYRTVTFSSELIKVVYEK